MKKIKQLILLITLVVTLSSCSNDDDNKPFENQKQSKEYRIEFVGYGASQVTYPLVITYYNDNQQGDIVSEVVTSQTNQDVVQNKTLDTYDKVGFKYNVENNDETLVYYVEIKDIETNEVIFTKSNLSIVKNKTFLYDISEDTFSIE